MWGPLQKKVQILHIFLPFLQNPTSEGGVGGLGLLWLKFAFLLGALGCDPLFPRKAATGQTSDSERGGVPVVVPLVSEGLCFRASLYPGGWAEASTAKAFVENPLFP